MEEAEKAAKRSLLAKKLAGIAAIYCIEKVQQSILRTFSTQRNLHCHF